MVGAMNEQIIKELEDKLNVGHVHNYGEWNPKVGATCDTDGTLGHYLCDCGKYFLSQISSS